VALGISRAEVFVKPSIVAFLLMSGLLVAGGANAAFLGNFTANCLVSNSTATVIGRVGDTFSVTAGGGYVCGAYFNPGGSVTPPGVFFAGTTQTYTIAAGRTITAAFLNGDRGLTLTIQQPAAAVPTLSEWAQLMLALMVIGIAWHFHNNRQNSY